MNHYVLISFFAYFAVLLAIGLIARRKQSTDADFIIGNRSLNFWLTAFSAQASDMSAWLFMAFPAAIFLSGVPGVWTAFSLVLGMFLNWHFVAPRLRTMTEQSNSYTLSTFFEKRFKDTSGILRVLTAIVTIIFLTSYLSAGLIAMGILLESLFGIEYWIGIGVATFVGMTYTFAGGYLTVAWTDLFQALFLLLMIIIVPIVAFLQLPDGMAQIESVAASKNISLHLFPEPNLLAYLEILFLLTWGLGYFGQPHIVTKFMGIKSPADLYKSKYLGISWQIICLAAAAFAGYIGIGFFPNGLENEELVFIHMVKEIFNPFFGGIILCGIIAANMSTMDSQILVCASILSEDFYKHIVHKHATPKDLLFVSRLGVILVGLIAYILAFDKSTTVLEVVFYAWSGLGCSLGPLMLMSLYSKTANRYGAVAGILVGGALTFGLWDYLNPLITSIEVPAMLPAFPLSLLSIYLVSKMTNRK